MIIENIAVENFRGLRDVSVKLSAFSCVIGENNAGKSSLLLALKIFIDGKRIPPNEFYDTSKDICITISLSSITEQDLRLIAEEHRPQIAVLVDSGKLILMRRFSISAAERIQCYRRMPQEERFRKDFYDLVLKGKKGKEITSCLRGNYPEITGERLSQVNTIGAAKNEIQILIDNLTPDQLKIEAAPLPTGIDNTISKFLPEPIYIPAVKDLGDDIKTRESTPFGKLLSILLSLAGDELSQAQKSFDILQRKLSRVEQPDGTFLDERLPDVKIIEETLEKYVRDTFSNTKLQIRIPPPDIKSILANAEIWADDGAMTRVETKGDGFKRAITFSILRSYVELSRKAIRLSDETGEDVFDSEVNYLFLFEEPELYLHPKAQKILFDALAQISHHHQVVISTHSPFFFSHESTSTFIKMTKQLPQDAYLKPYGEAICIDLSDMSEKDKFQLISFETGNTAFFADKIVLVEGDSDLIVYPHMARLINPDWMFGKSKIEIVKINGKASIKRFIDFFSRFKIKIFVIADLDLLLGSVDV